MGEFRMPSLGADMEAGTLVEWVKHPGDPVKRGDIIAVVDTQKGAIEIEVFEDGVLGETLVKPGDHVPVGTILAVIRDAPSPPDVPTAGPSPETQAAGVAATTPLTPAHAVAAAAPVVPPGATPAASAATQHRIRVSPLARKMAADLGVDLGRVEGTGSQGAITRADIERAASGAKGEPAEPVGGGAPAPTRVERAPEDRTTAMRAAIASAMARSKREIPHYYLSTTIDLSAVLTWLRRENEQRPMTERLLPAALLIKAVALALRTVPELNGYWANDGFRPGPGVHIGCAISLRGGGLVAPALHDVDALDLTTLMQKLQDLVARARSGSLRSSELADPTITITNLGEQGVESTFGIIYPPQVALVGFGAIAVRPWVAAGQVEARPLVTATLSADHRATDGHRGGVFLATLTRLLQTPDAL